MPRRSLQASFRPHRHVVSMAMPSHPGWRSWACPAHSHPQFNSMSPFAVIYIFHLQIQLHCMCNNCSEPKSFYALGCIAAARAILCVAAAVPAQDVCCVLTICSNVELTLVCAQCVPLHRPRLTQHWSRFRKHSNSFTSNCSSYTCDCLRCRDPSQGVKALSFVTVSGASDPHARQLALCKMLPSKVAVTNFVHAPRGIGNQWVKQSVVPL